MALPVTEHPDGHLGGALVRVDVVDADGVEDALRVGVVHAEAAVLHEAAHGMSTSVAMMSCGLFFFTRLAFFRTRRGHKGSCECVQAVQK